MGTSDPKGRSERAGLTFAVLFAFTTILGLITLKGGPALWARPWLAGLGLLAALTTAAFVRSVLLKKRYQAGEPATQTHQKPVSLSGRSSVLPKRAKRAVQAWTLGLIGWVVCAMLIVPAWITAHQLGSERGRATISYVEVYPHYRSRATVLVEFQTEDGRHISTRLRAANQDERTDYRPGTPIYYDRHDPRIAISEADYDDGGPHSQIALGLITGVFAAWTYWTIRFCRKHWQSA